MKSIANKFLMIALTIAAAALVSAAQEENPQPTPEPQQPNEQFRMMRDAIGLTPEQFQQIRRINAERRPLMQEAQMKLREANRALDDAIYSENVSEDEIKLKMKDVQLAQAEVIKVKTLTEFQIRRVLTPDQLEKFRQFRERLINRQKNPNKERPRPMDRLRERRNQRPIE